MFVDSPLHLTLAFYLTTISFYIDLVLKSIPGSSAFCTAPLRLSKHFSETGLFNYLHIYNTYWIPLQAVPSLYAPRHAFST